MTDMLVPEYLSPVAENAVQQDGEITLRLRCSCGCRRFRVEQMAFNSAEQRQADEYNQAVQQVMKTSCPPRAMP